MVVRKAQKKYMPNLFLTFFETTKIDTRKYAHLTESRKICNHKDY